MGDQVQQVLEGMVPELEDLEQKGLFSTGEIKAVVRKRTQFEYMTRRRVPRKEDFLRYIQYEMNVDQLRKKRRARTGPWPKTTVSDFSIARRIGNIYQVALRKFSDDVSLWLEYIEFLIRSGSSRSLNKVFPQALQTHSTKPLLWIRAASWEFEGNNNVKNARVMFQRGLRFNAESKELFLKFFHMEVMYLTRILERRQALGLDKAKEDQQTEEVKESEDMSGEEEAEVDKADGADGAGQGHEFLAGAIPLAIYNKAISTPSLDKDLDFRLQFLQLLPPPTAGDGTEEKDAFAELRAAIYDSVGADFDSDPKAWRIRALQAMQMKGAGPEGIEAAADVFERGVKALDTMGIWEEFASFREEVFMAALQKQNEAEGMDDSDDEAEQTVPESMNEECLAALDTLLGLLNHARTKNKLSVFTAQLWGRALLLVGRVEEARAVLDELAAERSFASNVSVHLLRANAHVQVHTRKLAEEPEPTKPKQSARKRRKTVTAEETQPVERIDNALEATSEVFDSTLHALKTKHYACCGAASVWTAYLQAKDQLLAMKEQLDSGEKHRMQLRTTYEDALNYQVACIRKKKTALRAPAPHVDPACDEYAKVSVLNLIRQQYLQWAQSLRSDDFEFLLGVCQYVLSISKFVPPSTDVLESCQDLLMPVAPKSTKPFSRWSSDDKKRMNALRSVFQKLVDECSDRHELWWRYITLEHSTGNVKEANHLYTSANKALPQGELSLLEQLYIERAAQA